MFKKLFGKKSEDEAKKTAEVVEKSKPVSKPPAQKFKPAPILMGQDRDWNVDYRRPDDKTNVIRVDQPKPSGFRVELFDFLPIAGVSYRLEAVQAFIDGKERKLSLKREFVNEQEPDAIAVWGMWRDAAGEHSAQLGYVPREAKDAIGDQPVAATLMVMYRATKEKGVGVRMKIWGRG